MRLKLGNKGDSDKSSLDIIIVISVILAILSIIEIRFGGYFFVHDDNLQSYLCLYKHTFDGLMHGSLSLYNFHQFMGIPFVDEGQSGVFNPLVYISVGLSKLFTGDVFATIDIMTFFALSAAGVTMYLLLKELGTGRCIAILGGIAWALNSFTVNMAKAWMITTFFTAIFPLMIFASIRLVYKSDLKSYIYAAIPRVLMFYTGHPQFFLYSVIFEGITYVMYTLIVKADRKTKLSCLARFCISYIPVVILCLPLLFIQFRATTNSEVRSNKIYWEFFLNGRMLPSDLVKGIFVPWMAKADYGDLANFKDINSNLAHVGYPVIIAILLIPVLIIVMVRKKADLRKLKVIIPFVPGAVIAVLWATSEAFLAIIYHIPMLNRFKFPFKLVLFFDFFIVVVGCLLMELILKSFFVKTLLRKVTLVLLIGSEILGYLVLYTIFPAPQYGISNKVTLPYKPGYIDLVKDDGRVVTTAYSMYYTKDVSLPDNFYIDSMGFNYATLYGVDNVLGYSVFLSKEFYMNLNELGIKYSENASFIETPPQLVELMTRYGAKWFILPKPSNPGEAFAALEEYLEKSGVVRHSEYETCYVYINTNAIALVHPVSDCNPQDTVTFVENINDIVINTSADFKADDIAMIYSYNERLHLYVDGKEEDIRISDDGTHLLASVPDGAHEVILRYQDESIILCTVILVAGMFVFCLGMRTGSLMRKISSVPSEENS